MTLPSAPNRGLSEAAHYSQEKAERKGFQHGSIAHFKSRGRTLTPLSHPVSLSA